MRFIKLLWIAGLSGLAGATSNEAKIFFANCLLNSALRADDTTVHLGRLLGEHRSSCPEAEHAMWSFIDRLKDMRSKPGDEIKDLLPIIREVFVEIFNPTLPASVDRPSLDGCDPSEISAPALKGAASRKYWAIVDIFEAGPTSIAELGFL